MADFECVTSLGRPLLAQLTRIYAEPLLACVADNRKMMRDAAMAAIEKVTTSGGKNRGFSHGVVNHNILGLQ